MSTRVLLSVVRPDGPGCWLWRGKRDATGAPWYYEDYRVSRPARLVWEALRGPLAKGERVRRTCAEPLCVRPEHHRLTGGPRPVCPECHRAL